MFIVEVKKLFATHEYKFRDEKDTCDFLIKIMDDMHKNGQNEFHYRVLFYDDFMGMNPPFDLRTRRRKMAINDYNRKLLKAKTAFEAELFSRAEREAVGPLEIKYDTKGNVINVERKEPIEKEEPKTGTTNNNEKN